MSTHLFFTSNKEPYPPMLTQLNIIHDERGYTVTVSTTHRTHAGALAHFTELLTQFTRDHHQAAAHRAAQAAAATGDTVLTGATKLPHRWEGPGHDGQPVPELPATNAALVATTAEADERAAPPAPALFRFARPGTRSPGGEEPPF